MYNNTFNFTNLREFPSRKMTKMDKKSNEDLDLPDMPVDNKVLNPHESCLYVRDESNNPAPDELKSEPSSRRTSPDNSPVRQQQTPPHVIFNEIDQTRWIDLYDGWRFQIKSRLDQIRKTEMIFAMFVHKSFENKNVSEEIPHARNGTFHVSYFLRNLNSVNEETDVHATYAYKNAKTKKNEKRHYGPRFDERTKKKAFKHTGKPFCLRELLELFNKSKPDESQIFINHIDELRQSMTIVSSNWGAVCDTWPMRKKTKRSSRRSSRR